MAKEIAWTAQVVNDLRKCNAEVLPIVASKYVSGWPDRHITHRLWSGFLEMKDDTTKLRPDQRQVLRRLRQTNPAHAFVCRRGDMFCTLEDEDSGVVATWDGTAPSLLKELSELRKQHMYGPIVTACEYVLHLIKHRSSDELITASEELNRIVNDLKSKGT